MNQQKQRLKEWRRSMKEDWASRPDEDKTETLSDGRRVHARYRSGSLELVSSDDVVFRVKKGSIVAGSEVFRHMVEFAKPSPIYLTHPHYETAAVLAIFLDLLHGKRLPLPKDLATRRIRELHGVYDLAIKYDCPFVLRQLHLNLRSSLFDGTLNPFFTFTLLSQFKDVEGCAEAIRRNGHAPFMIPRGDENLARKDPGPGWASGSGSDSGWGSASASASASVWNKDKLLRPAYNMGWADPTCWDIKNASRVDFRFHMALVRAFQKSGASHPLSKLDLEEIAVEFQMILRVKYPKTIDSRATTPSPGVSPLQWDLIHPEATPPDLHVHTPTRPIKRLSLRGMRRSLRRALTSVHEAQKF